MAETPTLAPCPFCGKPPFVASDDEGTEIECNNSNCGVTLGVAELESDTAAKAWNRRAAPPQDAERGEDDGGPRTERVTTSPVLHCPHCGPGQSMCDPFYNDSSRRWQVGCGRCGSSSGSARTAEEAVQGWNTRADYEAAALRARVAELEAERDRLRGKLREVWEFVQGERDGVDFEWADLGLTPLPAPLSEAICANTNCGHPVSAHTQFGCARCGCPSWPQNAALTPPPAPAAQGETATEEA